MTAVPTIITPKEITFSTLADALAIEDSNYIEFLSDPPIVFDDYQREFLNCNDRFQIWLKGRQLGFSFVAAAKALVRSQTLDDYTCIISSYKQDDAKEKIRYVKQIYDTLPDNYKKKKLIENQTNIEFIDKSGRKSIGTRIIAQGKGPLRGKGSGKVLDIILDEFAFFGSFDNPVYTSAVPVLTRVKKHGSLIIISTPLGRAGKFFDIWDNPKKFRSYKRRTIYWWDFSQLCKNVPKARKLAPSMPTLKRVEVFGTEQLHELFNALDLESFQQEYECAFIDDSTSYFPLAMIYECVMSDEGRHSEQSRLMAKSFDDLRRKTIGKLGGGYDVGRKKDASELISLDDTGETRILRHMETFKQSDFQLQEREVGKYLEEANPIRLCIDETGLGMQLAENLRKKYGRQVEKLSFTNAAKETMAIALHKEFEKGKGGILIPNDCDLISQIAAIKRDVTSTGAFRYAVERNEKHHGDKFWALALANHALGRSRRGSLGEAAGFSVGRSELADIHW